MTLFNELGLHDKIIKAVDDMGFVKASPIQEQVIPFAMEGMDIIGQAQTGTGKTAAFGIPLLSKIEEGSTELQSIVLAPTRELAIQVSEEINRLAKYKNINALPVYGGRHNETNKRTKEKTSNSCCNSRKIYGPYEKKDY